MAYTTINKSSLYMNTKLYAGTGSSNAITGVGFQPDMTWIKKRDGGSSHSITDAIRGVTKYVIPDVTNAEETDTNGLTAFGTDGFTVGSTGAFNGNGTNLVSWNWTANGAGSSNTAGSINTTYTSANTTSGFSIITYTGNGTSGATIGHGLSTAPQAVFIKKRTAANWTVGHVGVGWNKNGKLNTVDSWGTSALSFNNTAPTTSLITLGSGNVANANTGTYVCYAFSNIQGFSKMGYYTGNGNANGVFNYTGFKPSWIMIKRTDANNQWIMLNNKMSLYNNNTGDELYADSSATQNSFVDGGADFLSNGFKLRGTNGSVNLNGGTYIYMAFGQSIVGSNNVPATAR